MYHTGMKLAFYSAVYSSKSQPFFLLPCRESSGPRECDAAKLSRAATTAAINFPAVGDVYIMYPQRWAPFFLNFGSLIMGRAVGQWFLGYHANKGLRTITTGRFRGAIGLQSSKPDHFSCA